MEIEERIRTRIEAILVNDARSFSELKKMAAADEPLETDILADERNLYHRIINGYRSALSQVNRLLEQNIDSLSGFYRIAESIKEKGDLQEICSRIVDRILQDFGADYCSMLFQADSDSLCVEGIREEREFLRIHSRNSLLAGGDFENELIRMAEQAQDCLRIEDVYKEARFNAVDFPGVVRSLLCLPVVLHKTNVGFIILSHSLPAFFHDDHVRVLKVLGAIVAHLVFLHRGGRIGPCTAEAPPVKASTTPLPEPYSIALMEFETDDPCGRRVPLGKEEVRGIRLHIQRTLEGRESVCFYRERELLVFMPGVPQDSLPGRMRRLREAFERWRADRPDERRKIHLSVGCSGCEGEEDLSRILELATLVMHRDD